MGKWASWRRAKQPEEPTIWGCGRCQEKEGGEWVKISVPLGMLKYLGSLQTSPEYSQKQTLGLPVGHELGDPRCELASGTPWDSEALSWLTYMIQGQKSQSPSLHLKSPSFASGSL